MRLHGLGRVSAKPAGGVASVELVAAGSFTGAEYDPSEGCFVSASAAQPFAAYVFREDCAAYTETASDDAGRALVKHVLTMEFPGGEASRRAVDELRAASGEGFVALVTTGAGERLLAGYSQHFGTTYPLRLAKVLSASGVRPPDFPSVTVVLESTDADHSKPLRD